MTAPHPPRPARAEPPDAAARVQELGTRLVLQRPRLAVVDKPAGWLSVPGRRADEDPRPCAGRLLEKLLGARVFPVHRLDAEVGGLLLFALDPGAQRTASAWFEGRLVHKDYFAWSERDEETSMPAPEPRRWECLLARGKRRAYEHPVAGKPSLTLAWLLEARPTPAGAVLSWRLQPHTGRSHQLRYELARHGCPILGDTLYGAHLPWPPGGIALRAVALDLTTVPPGERLGLPARLELSGLPAP
ncbi:MAG: RNA pseudouridine synthase [Myxococcota bacterium]|nr:RNA pseudouridine synthase [Myxococcota bacterium]